MMFMTFMIPRQIQILMVLKMPVTKYIHGMTTEKPDANTRAAHNKQNASATTVKQS